MEICELNKFIDKLKEFNLDRENEDYVQLLIDCYRFDPIEEEATISKGKDSIVIDLTLSNDDQLSLFQTFIETLS